MLAARQEAESLEEQSAVAFADAIKHLESALVADEEHESARQQLGELWCGRLRAAELRGEQRVAAFALSMLERHGRGTFQAVIDGEGTLSVDSSPPGAEATLIRFVSRDGVMVEDDNTDLGATPVDPIPVSMGSYLILLRKSGYEDLRLPIHVGRNSEVQASAALRTKDEIGQEFILVPGGDFISGEGSRTRLRPLPDFAISRYPVTFAEYAKFLESLGESEANARLPRTRGDGPLMCRGSDGRFEPQTSLADSVPHGALFLERFGPGFARQMPVVAVSFDDAVAYCLWKSEATGWELRLPTEHEREKAARGVDGRRFPWGGLEDPSLGKCRDSRPETPFLEPIGTFPTAESVYGMGDAAGNVWDWTDSWLDERRLWRVLRGGCWLNAAAFMRCAVRFGMPPDFRYTRVGFRCVRNLR